MTCGNVVMITHRAREAGVMAAIQEISATDYVTGQTCLLRIEEA